LPDMPRILCRLESDGTIGKSIKRNIKQKIHLFSVTKL